MVQRLLNNLSKERLTQCLLAGLAILFFVLYAHLYASTPAIFNSPDETANYVFSQEWRETRTFLLPFDREMNPDLVVRPRSVNIINDNYIPGGFLGLPFLLAIAESLVDGSSLYVPALISVIGVLCFYGILRRIFEEEVALVSTVVLFSLPQWWHFAAKGFLPNILFVSLLMIGGYLLIRAHELNKVHHYLLSLFSGFVLTYALFIRPAELGWVVLMFAFIFLIKRKELNYRVLILALIGGCIVVLLAAVLHNQTFGGVLNTGYDQLASASSQVEQAFGSKLSLLLFPFGIDLKLVLQNTFNYWFKLFWWQVALVAIGVAVFLKKTNKKNEQVNYLVILVIISFYLLLFYGSWGITDDLDSGRISVGISYTRYWLPIFIGSLPFLVLGMRALARKFSTNFIVFILLVFTVISGHVFFVYSAKDNLSDIQKSVVNYSHVRGEIEKLTDENSVIISERNDKVFWPIRDVIHYQDQDFSFVDSLEALVQVRPIYWATILPRDHVSIWEETVFFEHSLQLDFVKSLPNNIDLYQVFYDQNSAI